MNEQEKAKRLEEILMDESLVRRLNAAESKPALQASFGELGLDMSCEEIDTFINLMNSATDDSLAEESLENVVGGAFGAVWIFSTSWKIMKKIAKNCWDAGRWLATKV